MLELQKKKLSIELDWTSKKNNRSFLSFTKKKEENQSIDLDLSVTFIDFQGRFIDRTVSYLNHTSRGVLYHNDDQCGDDLKDGNPNEKITIETSLTNPNVRYVGVFINNLDCKLDSFNELENVTLIIKENESQILRVCLSNDDKFSGSNCTIAGYFDKENQWEFINIMEPHKDKNLRNFELMFRNIINSK